MVCRSPLLALLQIFAARECGPALVRKSNRPVGEVAGGYLARPEIFNFCMAMKIRILRRDGFCSASRIGGLGVCAQDAQGQGIGEDAALLPRPGGRRGVQQRPRRCGLAFLICMNGIYQNGAEPATKHIPAAVAAGLSEIARSAFFSMGSTPSGCACYHQIEFAHCIARCSGQQCQTSGSVRRMFANPARSGRKQR